MKSLNEKSTPEIIVFKIVRMKLELQEHASAPTPCHAAEGETSSGGGIWLGVAPRRIYTVLKFYPSMRLWEGYSWKTNVLSEF